MPFKSRWEIEVPNTHLASLLFTSPTHPLSKTHRSFSEAARPDTHYFTTHDFRLWCQRFAAGLLKSGLQPGDRVLLLSGNDIFFPVVFLGVAMAGVVFTGANPTYVARELAYQLQDSGATYLICAEGSLDTGIEGAKIAGLGLDKVFVFNDAIYDGKGEGKKGCRDWGELIASAEEGNAFAWDPLSTPEKASQTLALNYSSGTTGKPKGVEISHKNYCANMLQYNHLFYMSPDWKEKEKRARWLCFLPMYHALAQNIFIAAALNRGVPVYIMPQFDFLKMLEYTEKFRITDYILVPPVVVALAKHPAAKSGKYDLSSVELIGSGAAPLGRDVCEEAEALWPPGCINVKQAWGMTKTTCSVLGWSPNDISHSASVGELNANCEAKIMDDDGVTELGRNQRGELWELIKVKGNQVAPAELEALLLEHPAVADVAVIGVPSNNDESPRAYNVLKPGHSATANDVIAFMDGKIPKNPSGKILRKVLQEQAKEEMQTNGAVAKL
ncbi:putative 4-coumarate-CoA ligase [Talaromyces proteolyticus]|uniref:4-coumarate-CoA ligase n=1 Tax=Talaromyces proteolyticus TaxID=1131652 RepID=A0AAD4KM94_9EURO|nr:putative 4-coumarate-CoA ligase [Talaromyces proteolyticus]KAH8691350.1 putative 4-coumarate-CoA ligase [Talaromyces proteolyticus]